MNKSVSIFIILLTSLLFLIFERQSIEYYKVLEVIEGDKIYVDLNKNGKKDNDEIIHLRNINTFPIKYNSKIEQYSKRYNLTPNECIFLGQMAKKYTTEKLLGKEITFKNKLAPYNPKYYYRFSEVYLDGDDFAIFLLNEGLAFSYEGNGFNFYKTYEDLKKIKKNAKLCPDAACSKNNAGNFKKSEQKQWFQRGNNTKTLVYTESPVLNYGDVTVFLVNPNTFNKPSYSCKTRACKAILDNINNAQNSIDFALYGLDKQDDILKALIEAKKRGVKIRGVMDSKPDNSYVYPDTAKLNANFDTISDFKPHFMHNKFFIFDNKAVITGTMNISAAGAGGYNANTVLLIKNSSLASVYTQEFERMYTGKFGTAKDSAPSSVMLNNGVCVDIYFSPASNPLYNGILPILTQAEKEIFVSIFYLTNKEIIEALIAAKQRGVDVKIIYDAVGANSMKEKVRTLRQSGVLLKVENWGGKNHEKNMVIDGKYFITGSANFSNSGMKKNDENILIFKCPEIAKFYRKHFLNLYNSIDDKYLKYTPRAESFESGNSCYDGIDNNFDGKKDSEDAGCKR